MDFEKWKPNADGSCKTKGCKGTIVRMVMDNQGGKTQPMCSKCGREYPLAKNVSTAGWKEFANMQHIPMTR